MKERLSPAIELANLLHPGTSVDRWMAMLTAFCDESGIHQGARIFTISGYVGKAREWKRLERKWKRALQKEGLAEFHMAECEGGYGAFSDLHDARYRPERDRLQRRFINIILECDICAVGSGIDMLAYQNLLPRLIKIWESIKYAKSPYFLGFEHFLMEACHRVEYASDVEQMAFVFDRQKQVQGRAKELYDQTCELPDGQITYRNRLGSLAFSAKSGPQGQVGLQAADIIAYEAFQYRTDHRIDGHPIRWQFEMLESHPNGMSGKFFDEDGLELLLKEFGC
jgi:hypothetical protein